MSLKALSRNQSRTQNGLGPPAQMSRNTPMVTCMYIYKVVASVCLFVCLSVCLSVCMFVCFYSHNSSLGARRQKSIGALNSAGIGEGVKLKINSKIVPKKLARSGKS